MVKRMMITAAVALVVMPAVASAQLATGSVTATATVAQYAALTGSTDLAFGTLSRSSDNTINSEGGTVTRTLTYNNNVTVSFQNVPTALAHTTIAGANSLAVALNCSARVGTGAWSTAACSSASFNLDVGAGLTTATLGFGGTITAVNVQNAVAGAYSATFDIRVVAR